MDNAVKLKILEVDGALPHAMRMHKRYMFRCPRVGESAVLYLQSSALFSSDFTGYIRVFGKFAAVVGKTWNFGEISVSVGRVTFLGMNFRRSSDFLISPESLTRTHL